ncbi:PQQ-dependent sugar dehydrogenase [Adhaeribacter rhizoryzae]|uniref:Carbohydrate-binding protein n=1 Tax=Adhaeribacter rhizoryzae TaxID=2607907 RepID=A0A5M6DCK4_9BACT|nr:PQQ-dependent sugar dehydrogenase [Adhaeribacter rhizoryzae]KAA5542885.1 carbohydrate-binding protein [Adhaeribacter rhizoryzae]
MKPKNISISDYRKSIFPVARWYALAALILLSTVGLLSFRSTQQKILIFSKPAGAEASRQAHLALLQKLSDGRKITVDTTANPAYFSEDSLKAYNAVVFLHAPLEALDYRQQADLERYVQAGGGVMALNAATDTVRNWPWYQSLNAARLKAAKPLWEAKYDGGRVYFAQLGADAAAKNLESTLAKGLKFVAGKGNLNYSKATTDRVPEPNRFVTEVLETYMYEPMEMVIFKDGRVLYLERRGNVKLYDPKKRTSRVIAKFDVSITGNYEDGMLGVALDPNYEKNHWIYINYSPAGDIPKQNVSRFEMIGDSLNMKSEKIVLEIPTQRETCCHSGGHLEFGPNGDLYISSGDNTSSKESDGFSPIDERPGRMPFDAQKSSGNTNSLTGKILRIHPEPDGSYTIPEGNLFPKGTPNTKPEIYAMGTRNAFRFTVDQRNGYVYWGDVGPDGGVTNERGPQSYDEWNQARKAGNFGWPYFVGNNFAYADFDFATNKIGPKFNPEKPENTSPNNTGQKILPPAQKPMIWYPYGVSREFPELGKGSRSAMAGPVYYADNYPAASRFPKYYDGKLFIYEWARSWVKVISFDKDKNLAKIEPFLPEQEWYKPIDMKFGPDGALYVLQYGANYFEHNPDSRLIKITYSEGNRQPIAKITADRTVGAAPLTVNLSAAQSFDYDKNDKLNYSFDFGNQSGTSNNQPTASVTYTKPGIYRPSVTVTDAEGKKTIADLEVKVGNEPPQVTVDLGKGNRSFYFDNQKLNYQVKVTDKEDGTLQKGVDPANVFFSFDYLKVGRDLALLASNTQMTGGFKYLRGKTLVANSDCKSCHDVSKNSIGPSYIAVAERYRGKTGSEDMLATKIIKGGNGTWGKNMMAPHPQHTKEETTEMAQYILSLSNKQNIGMPLQGTVTTSEHVGAPRPGAYVIRASYADKGNQPIGSLTGSTVLLLRSPKIQAEEFDLTKNIGRRHIDGSDFTFVTDVQNGSYLGLNKIDLTAISKLTFRGGARQAGSRIEIRQGSPDGKLLATAAVPVTPKEEDMQTFSANIANPGEPQDLYLVFRNDNVKNNLLQLDWVNFESGQSTASNK